MASWRLGGCTNIPGGSIRWISQNTIFCSVGMQRFHRPLCMSNGGSSEDVGFGGAPIEVGAGERVGNSGEQTLAVPLFAGMYG